MTQTEVCALEIPTFQRRSAKENSKYRSSQIKIVLKKYYGMQSIVFRESTHSTACTFVLNFFGVNGMLKIACPILFLQRLPFLWRLTGVEFWKELTAFSGVKFLHSLELSFEVFRRIWLILKRLRSLNVKFSTTILWKLALKQEHGDWKKNMYCNVISHRLWWIFVLIFMHFTH